MEAQEETGVRLWEAELHHLKGIALLGLNRLEEGRTALEEALRVAQRQQSKAYQLRTEVGKPLRVTAGAKIPH